MLKCFWSIDHGGRHTPICLKPFCKSSSSELRRCNIEFLYTRLVAVAFYSLYQSWPSFCLQYFIVESNLLPYAPTKIRTIVLLCQDSKSLKQIRLVDQMKMNFGLEIFKLRTLKTFSTTTNHQTVAVLRKRLGCRVQMLAQNHRLYVTVKLGL